MLINYDFPRYRFFGIDGNHHVIRGCPALYFQDLRDWYKMLHNLINDADINQYPDFATLYQNDLEVRSLCHEILKLHQINLLWVDLDMLVAFVHHTVDQEGKNAPSLIAQLNKLDTPKEPSDPDKKRVTLDEHIYNLLLDLQSTGLARNLEEAKTIIADTPLDELEAIIANQLERLKTPEQKKKEKEDKEMEQTAQEFQEAWQSGGMFKPGITQVYTPETFNQRK